MASTTISLSTEAYNLLKKSKAPGESFSDVIISNFQPPARTGIEILERLERIKGPLIDRELMAKVRAERGRRSHRKAARVRR
jgi:predicted CopG family antitoxin